MTHVALEVRILDPTLEEELAQFFRALVEAGDEGRFHPHPFTEEEAHRRTTYHGQDLYYALIEGSRILGYGMLRGWDQGYDVPSLGIVIHPDMRGQHLGELLVRFLHAAARRRGATRVRLRVHPNNLEALNLYRQLGYLFEGEEAGQLVGFLNL